MPTPRVRAPSTASLLLVAATVALAELLRVSFPMLYALAEDIGFLTAAAVVPALFALPLLAAPVGRFVGPRAMVGIGGALLGAARAVAQVQATPGLVVVMVGVVAGLVVLPVLLRVVVARRGAASATGALFVGLAIDAGVRLAFVTWDPAWQTGIAALLVGLLIATAVLVATTLLVRSASRTWGPDRVRTGLVVGPVVALQTLALASPGFVASSAGVGLALAGAVVVVGLGLAAAGLVPTGGTRRAVLAVAAVAVVAVPAVATGPTALGGPVVVLAVLAAQWAVGCLVVTALRRAERTPAHLPAEDRAGPARALRTGVGAGLGALVLVAGLLPYQISYELPLGVPQAAWPVLVALVMVAVGVVAPPEVVDESAADPSVAGRRAPGEPSVRQAGGPGGGRAGTATALLAVAPVLVVPAVLALTAPGPARGAGSGPAGEVPVRVATYNLHSGVGVDGRLDPERIARVLSDGGGEVMALQEVARGWPLAGGIDLASWLARRLDAEFVYGPAADRQFGNAVLATRSIQRWRAGTMPRGEGPMRRGWVAATVAFDDDVLEVFSIHLQHQDDTTATRRDQARMVLAAWDGAERTVLAGDFNSTPGSPDVEPWFDGTGLVSAQDTGGGVPVLTAPAADPQVRIDWVLGTPDLVFADVEVPATTASDHLPIFTSVSARSSVP